MNGIRTAPKFIDWMWKENYFTKAITVKIIQDLASDKGYTFTRDTIRKALDRSKTITQFGKLSNRVPLYKQTHPYSSKEGSTEIVEHEQIFDSLDLHPEIRKVSEKLFKDEHFFEAIFAAFKKVNNMVKVKSGETKRDGRNLMLFTFSPNDPKLKVNQLKTQSDKDEQEGFMNIFAGVMSAIRNPRGHDEELPDTAMDTIELLCMASTLAKIVTKSKK